MVIEDGDPWLTEHQAGVCEAFRAATGESVTCLQRLAGGEGNRTYAGDVDESNDRLVLRIYFRDPTACARELCLAELLDGVVPVPKVVYTDPSGSLLGQPVMVSRFVPGQQVGRAVTDETAVGIGRALGLTLGALLNVRFPGPGWLATADLTVEARERSLAAGVRMHVDRMLYETDGGRELDSLARDRFWGMVDNAVDGLGVLEDQRSLVHADFCDQNILVATDDLRWRVTAVLDWEFAFSGPALMDLGSALRLAPYRPAGYEQALLSAYVEAGGVLAGPWRKLAWLMDLVPLTGGLSRPVGHPSRVTAHRIIHDTAAGKFPFLELG